MTGSQDFDPVRAFPHFYDNEAIASLAPHRAWTVSDSDKMPINIQELARSGAIWGASYARPDTDLATLDELSSVLPEARNCTLHFDSHLMGAMLLDIEPSCPPAVTDQLLSMALDQGPDAPRALYTETSMSGRGYHLLMPVPRNLDAYPEARRKVALRHPEGWYEVLLYHWITFTRSPVPERRLQHAVQARATAGDRRAVMWEAVYAQLALQARNGVSASELEFDTLALLQADLSDETRALDASATSVVRDMFRRSAGQRRTISDFSGDTSRWEFGQIAFIARNLYHELNKHLRLNSLRGPVPGLPARIGADHVSRLTYELACELIPRRPKHEGYRQGMPFLLYQAAIAATAVLEEEQK